jgi:hypothetical protein
MLENFADREGANCVLSEAASSGFVGRYRFPGAMQRTALLRRTGTPVTVLASGAPALQRIASRRSYALRCVRGTQRVMRGLDPRIHQSSQKHFFEKMDCRVKPALSAMRVARLEKQGPEPKQANREMKKGTNYRKLAPRVPS